MTMNPLNGAACKDLISPILGNLFSPLTHAWGNLKTIATLSPQPEDYEKSIKTLGSTLLSVAIFAAHYFVSKQVHARNYGSLGSLICSLGLYQLGNWLNPQANYIGASSWFLVTGINGLLTTEKPDPIAALNLLFVRPCPKIDPQPIQNKYLTGVAGRLAHFHRWLKPAPGQQPPSQQTN